jgi:hypothetical protein
MPMLRAVPAIMLMAASMDAALRSGIFVSAILRMSSLVTDATLSLLGMADPFSWPLAFFNKTAAGGVFVMKE